LEQSREIMNCATLHEFSRENSSGGIFKGG
jgi:hypothetical protein